jgi:hypothetical protein
MVCLVNTRLTCWPRSYCASCGTELLLSVALGWRGRDRAPQLRRCLCDDWRQPNRPPRSSWRQHVRDFLCHPNAIWVRKNWDFSKNWYGNFKVLLRNPHSSQSMLCRWPFPTWSTVRVRSGSPWAATDSKLTTNFSFHLFNRFRPRVWVTH